MPRSRAASGSSAVGDTLAYLVYTFGTLFTGGALAVIPAICGGAAVACFAAVVIHLIRKANQSLKAEYELKAKA